MLARTSVLAFLFGALAVAASAQQYGIYRPYVEVKVRSPYMQIHQGDETFSKNFDWSMANSKANETDVTVFLTAEFALEWSLAKSRNDFSLSTHYGYTSHLGSLQIRMENFVLQLHYPTENRVKPYFGLGVNRTKAQGSFSAQYPSPFFGFDYSGRGYTWGWVAQVGVDFLMRWNIVINVDFKYIWNDALIKSVRNAGPTTGQTTGYDLSINPTLFGLGVGFRW